MGSVLVWLIRGFDSSSKRATIAQSVELSFTPIPFISKKDLQKNRLPPAIGIRPCTTSTDNIDTHRNLANIRDRSAHLKLASQLRKLQIA